MAKPVIRWKPVTAEDPSDRTKSVTYPMIVDRLEPLDLVDVAYQAIDTGRIAGLKTSAAESIGKGLAEQIGQILNQGRGVKFGDYFYVRFYLDGTLKSADAGLGASNQLNVRLMAGEGLRLQKSNFLFKSSVEDADDPEFDNVYSDVTGAEVGYINKNAAIILTGVNLKMNTGDTLTVAWTEEETEHTITVTASGLNSNPQLKVSWPEVLSELDAGTEVEFRLAKAVEYGGTPVTKTATIKATIRSAA